jgi:hypothetical protein
MDLAPYVDALRHDLAVAADAGGDEARALAERLLAPLESAVRLVLLDVLSAAAGEITRDLAPGSVDVRLRGREPEFVVTAPPGERAYDGDAADPAPVRAAPAPDAEDAAMTRINLRLPQDLKDRVEGAAAAAGVSVNAWLVRAAATALGEGDPGRRRDKREQGGAGRYTGWVR